MLASFQWHRTGQDRIGRDKETAEDRIGVNWESIYSKLCSTMAFVPPTEVELKQIEELRLLVHSSEISCQLTDVGLLRFLRGRGRVVENAFKSIARHAQWRMEHNVDEWKNYNIDEEKSKNKAYRHGVDKDGKPVVYVFARRHRTSDRDIAELYKFIVYQIEDALAYSLPHEERLVIVFDLARFTFDSMDYEAVKALIEVMQYNYPDSLHAILIVNEPWIFKACWVIIRGWLDPVTAGKVNFIPLASLSDFVAEEQMPEDLTMCLP